MTQWRRARTEDKKQVRVQEALDVARRLLLTQSYDTIRFATIAKELSFTRGNLYKYFKSKEEIYLTLLAVEVQSFANTLHHECARQNPERTVEGFIAFWTHEVAQRGVMLQLLSAAGNILEKNCSDDVLVASKKQMTAALTDRVVPILQDFFPHWDAAQVQASHHVLYVTAAGLFGFCGLRPAQKQLLRDNGLEQLLSEDFETEYRRLLQHIRFGQA